MSNDVVNFKIEGLDVIGKELEKLTRRAEGKAKRLSLRKGAKVILEEARARAPDKTGTLKASLAVTYNGRLKAAFVVARKGKGLKNDGWYAHIVELGAAPHSIRKGKKPPLKKKHPGARKQPFLRPALKIKAPEAIEVTGKELWIQLQAAILRGD